MKNKTLNDSMALRSMILLAGAFTACEGTSASLERAKLASAPYQQTLPIAMAEDDAADTGSFKFCVTKLEIEGIHSPSEDMEEPETASDEDGDGLEEIANTEAADGEEESESEEESEDELEDADTEDGDSYAHESELKPGLIDLGDGTEEIVWGRLDFPAGTQVSGIEVEVHRDPELCDGFDHSVQYGADTLARDIELEFTFDEPQTIPEDGVLVIDLSPIVEAYESAIAAGSFNDEDISEFIEGVEGRMDADEED